MKKLLIFLFLPLLAFGQATTAYHRIGQVLARAPLGSVNAQVVPFATVVVSYTSSGAAASIFSDPGLTVGIADSTLNADSEGNYDYYFALNTCVTETIMSPNGGITTIPNICANVAGGCPSAPCTINEGGTSATTQAGAFANIVAPGGTLTGQVNSTYSGTDSYSGPFTSPQINGIYAVDGVHFTTIQSAVNAAQAARGGIVVVPPGVYTENVTISASNITIAGGGIQATTLNPANNTCAFTFSGGNGSGINYNTLKDLSIANTTSSGDGICFTGGANIPNDRTLVTRVAVIGFRYNLNIIGRAIWDNFVDDYFESATLSNVFASTASVVNAIEFKDGRIAGAQQYGVYWNNTNVTGTSQGISFDHVNIENNGASGTLANCAGLYLTGIGSGQISNGSYFEANCVTNPDNLGSDVRLSGTYAQAFSIRDSLLWSTTNYAIFNDAIQTTGTYEGNNLSFASVDRIKIATTHALSEVTVGDNFLNGGVNLYVPDSNSNTHVTSTFPIGTEETVISSVVSNTISAALSSHIYLQCGGCSISTITGGVAGQILYITANTGTATLTNGTSANGIRLADATNRSLATNFSVEVTFDGNAGYWKEIVPQLSNLNVGNFAATGTITGFTVNATNGFQYNGAAPSGHCLIGNGTVYADASTCAVLVSSLSTSGGTTDNVTVTGMTSSGHCTFSPTTASAATNIATTYISNKTTNQITVTHTATASMGYDIHCTPY